MIAGGAVRSVGMLHKITKPTSWRIDPQVLEDVSEDTQTIEGSLGEQDGAGSSRSTGRRSLPTKDAEE